MKINCHCHIFSLDCVPREFRQRFLIDADQPVHSAARRMLLRVLPESSRFQDWLEFVDLSIDEIASRLLAEMDEAGTDLATPLMMDMAYCPHFGGGTKSFDDQLAETAAAVQTINAQAGRTRLLPFIAADPNRPGVVRLVADALDAGTFGGVKIYPVMGFTPDDRRLFPLYEHCAPRRIPITAHCEEGGIPGLTHYYGFAHPVYWQRVLEHFPDLTLNLAHNDRSGTPWQHRIAELIQTHPNVYTDVSFATEMWYRPRRFFTHLKTMLATPILQDRVLYGTDWYMGRFLWTESSYEAWFRDYAARIPWCRVRFTDAEMTRIMETNPARFLNHPAPT